MSLGYAGAAAGALTRSETVWSPEKAWDRIEETWDRFEDRVLRQVWGWVDRIVRFSFWVLERVRVTYPVEWYQWVTLADERVCPECGPSHGEQWPETQVHGAPPLHTNCRCRIEHAFTEWRFRWVEEWRLRWGQRVAYDWQQIGTRVETSYRWRRTQTQQRGDYEWRQVSWF